MKAPENTTDLKRFLLEQMVNVAEGKQDPPQAKAICNYVQQIYNVTNLEVKYAAMRAKFGGTSVDGINLVPPASSE